MLIKMEKNKTFVGGHQFKAPKRTTKYRTKEQLQADLIKKKECDAKALIVVEQLLDINIGEETFIHCLNSINESHYQDIVEERAIVKHCGYPVCNNPLNDVPAKQFHISTKQNKVFNICERKNFCSNLCYKASNYVKKQLFTGPLWLRDIEETTNYRLLPLDSEVGSAGDEVNLGHEPVRLEAPISLDGDTSFEAVDELSKGALSNSSLKIDSYEKKVNGKRREIQIHGSTESTNEIMHHISDIKDKHLNTNCATGKSTDVDKNMLTNKLCGLSEIESVQSCSQGTTILFQDSTPSVVLKNNSMINTTNNGAVRNKVPLCEMQKEYKCKSAESNESIKELSNKIELRKVPQNTKKVRYKLKNTDASLVNAVVKLEQCINEWFSLESMCYLFGEAKVNKIFSNKGEYMKQYSAVNSPLNPFIYERYLAICKQLKVLEVEDSKYDSSVKNFEQEISPLKPLPDYKSLQEEANKMEIKVRSFYKGDARVTFDENASDLPDNATPSQILPLVDLHAQKAHRRKIVLDKLYRVLPDLLQALGLNNLNIVGEVRHLVTSFTLSADNIMFKPHEWNFIGLVILKLLSVRDGKLREYMSSKTSEKYLTLMLMSYQLDAGYLDRLMSWLTDFDVLLQNKYAR